MNRVEITLEQVPEYMTGVLRCESVRSYNEDDDMTDHQELIDNMEFHSENELIQYVAKKLNVSTDIIEII